MPADDSPSGCTSITEPTVTHRVAGTFPLETAKNSRNAFSTWACASRIPDFDPKPVDNESCKRVATRSRQESTPRKGFRIQNKQSGIAAMTSAHGKRSLRMGNGKIDGEHRSSNAPQTCFAWETDGSHRRSLFFDENTCERPPHTGSERKTGGSRRNRPSRSSMTVTVSRCSGRRDHHDRRSARPTRRIHRLRRVRDLPSRPDDSGAPGPCRPRPGASPRFRRRSGRCPRPA